MKAVDPRKHYLTIRSRFWWFIDGIKTLSETWIWVANKPGHYTYYPWKQRIEDCLSSIDTAIRGYLLHYRLSTQRVSDE